MTRLSRWLLSPTPSSQWQARMGRVTFAALDFAASPAAMAGLAIVLLLIFVAAFAPWLATHDLRKRIGLEPTSSDVTFTAGWFTVPASR